MTMENWSFDDSTTGIFSQSEAVAYWKNLDDHMISFLVFPAVFYYRILYDTSYYRETLADPARYQRIPTDTL